MIKNMKVGKSSEPLKLASAVINEVRKSNTVVLSFIGSAGEVTSKALCILGDLKKDGEVLDIQPLPKQKLNDNSIWNIQVSMKAAYSNPTNYKFINSLEDFDKMIDELKFKNIIAEHKESSVTLTFCDKEI